MIEGEKVIFQDLTPIYYLDVVMVRLNFLDKEIQDSRPDPDLC
jgi:hypothetical protein